MAVCSTTIRHRLADLLPAGEVPLVRKTGALGGFDGLDAAGVTVEHDAFVVVAFGERESLAIGTQAGKTADEGVLGRRSACRGPAGRRGCAGCRNVPGVGSSRGYGSVAEITIHLRHLALLAHCAAWADLSQSLPVATSRAANMVVVPLRT